jgi:putative resolvase
MKLHTARNKGSPRNPPQTTSIQKICMPNETSETVPKTRERNLKPARNAAQEIGVSYSTLFRWKRQNLGKHVVTPTGRILYDVDSVLAPVVDGSRRRPRSVGVGSDPQQPATALSPDSASRSSLRSHDWQHVVYCRVSSPAQRPDLDRQIDALRRKYPAHRVVTDVASGINFRRRGLLQILDAAMRGDLRELVVAHRDRLARFAFDLIAWILQRHGARLVVDGEGNGPDAASPKSDLAEDLLAIVHVFASRFHGLRRYEKLLEGTEGTSAREQAATGTSSRKQKRGLPSSDEAPVAASTASRSITGDSNSRSHKNRRTSGDAFASSVSHQKRLSAQKKARRAR